MSRRRRWITGVVLACILTAIAIGVLAFATAWTPLPAARCFMDIAHSQFPKWLGCAIATHEFLAGALIATAGALFSAWLAFSSLQDQIGIVRKNELEARRLAHERRLQDAARDLDLMKLAHGFVTGIADSFPRPSDMEPLLKGASANWLLVLRRGGGLKISSSAMQAPDGNGDSIATVVSRLSTLADSIYEETKSLAVDASANILQARDAEVISHVAALRTLASLLRDRIPRYQQRFEELSKQSGGLV